MKQMTKIKKQLESKSLQTIEKENIEFTKDLKNELNTNLEFSLDVDPTNKYSMSDEQKLFIKNYVEFKNIKMAAEATGIDINIAKAYYISYSSQQEIRRINRAMYQRQFSSKLLTIDQLTSYLSSLITDENVPIADRVKTMDKVRIAQILIDLQFYKNNAINNPDDIFNTDVETEIKALSINSIKMLLEQKSKINTNDIIEVMPNEKLLPEEEIFLKTLPAKDILKLINETNNKDKEELK